MIRSARCLDLCAGRPHIAAVQVERASISTREGAHAAAVDQARYVRFAGLFLNWLAAYSVSPVVVSDPVSSADAVASISLILPAASA